MLILHNAGHWKLSSKSELQLSFWYTTYEGLKRPQQHKDPTNPMVRNPLGWAENLGIMLQVLGRRGLPKALKLAMVPKSYRPSHYGLRMLPYEGPLTSSGFSLETEERGVYRRPLEGANEGMV